jgi:hypothetical protein
MANLKTRRVSGSLVFWDTHLWRWIDAIGSNVTKYLNDFVNVTLGAADAPDDWTVTLVEAGAGESTITLDTATQGGALLLTTDDAENDGISMQLKGESFQLVSGTKIYFGIKLKINDATQSDFFAGLAITDTTILGGCTDYVGFRKVDGSTTVNAVLNKNTTETTGAALTCDTSYHIYEFYFDGTSVHFLVDGTEITALAQTNLPDDEMLTPSVEFLTGMAAAKIMTIDWLRVIQIV